MRAQSACPIECATLSLDAPRQSVLGYILGFYFSHRQLESIRREVKAKIDTLRAEMKQGFTELRLEFHALNSAISLLNRVEERLNLVERP